MVRLFRGRFASSPTGTTAPGASDPEPPARHFPAAAVPRPRPPAPPPVDPLDVTTSRSGDRLVVVVTGELLQETADVFSAVVDAALAAVPRVAAVTVDLRPTTFLDSTGLGRLVSLRHRLGELDVDLAVVKPAERVFRLFEITHLDAVFAFVPGETTPAGQAEGANR